MSVVEQGDNPAAQQFAAVSQLAVEQGRADLVKRIVDELGRARRTDPTTLVLAGEVSCGKTTLTNALASSPGLLPADVDVATGVFVVVGYAESPRARVFTGESASAIDTSVEEIADWVSVAREPQQREGRTARRGRRAITATGRRRAIHRHPGRRRTGFPARRDGADGKLAGADALLSSSTQPAPLSSPELRFLTRASANIQTVVFALSKADLNPGWKTVLDEDRRLLEEHAPRFAKRRISRSELPDAERAERKRRAGDVAEADRLAERSRTPGVGVRAAHIGDPAIRRRARRTAIDSDSRSWRNWTWAAPSRRRLCAGTRRPSNA